MDIERVKIDNEGRKEGGKITQTYVMTVNKEIGKWEMNKNKRDNKRRHLRQKAEKMADKIY